MATKNAAQTEVASKLAAEEVVNSKSSLEASVKEEEAEVVARAAKLEALRAKVADPELSAVKKGIAVQKLHEAENQDHKLADMVKITHEAALRNIEKNIQKAADKAAEAAAMVLRCKELEKELETTEREVS